MKKLIALAAVAVCGIAFADTYDERLEFLETTGTQWIDTGLRLNFRRARMEARFRMLEIPDSMQALCGTLDQKDNYGGRDYKKGATIRSFALRVGYSSNPDIKANRLTLGWTGSEGPGFVAGVDTTGGYEVKIDCTTGLVNRVTSCGRPDLADYSWRYRPDELIGEGKTYYIGNINNAGEGLGTPSGSMPKVHWYGLRLWHDDTLIGDFIPVMKDGVAGFFDTVTEKFFPSQGEDPFVAPNRIVWTGEGAADNLLDGGNWKGGVAPSTVHDIAVFPAGVTADGTYTDIATLAGIGGIDVQGADTLLRFASATRSPGKAWAAPFFGKGTIRFANISSSYGCSFNAENSSFEGLVDISNAVVILNRVHAFGGEKATVRYYSNVSDQRLSVNTGLAPIPTSFTFLRTGQYVFADTGVHFAGKVVFDPCGTITLHGNGSHLVEFSGPVTNRSSVSTYCEAQSARIEFIGEPKHLGKLRMRAEGFNISTPLGCELMPKSGVKDQVNLGLWPNSTGFKFEVDNALDEYAAILVNWDYNLYNAYKRHVNLNGHSQTIGTLSVHSENWFYWNDPTKGHFATNTIIWSDTPATLTLAGYCRNNMLYPEKNYVYPGQLNGELSFVLDSRTNVMATAYDELPDNCGIIRFTSALSTTCGGITAKRGLIDIRSQAAFSNLTALAVTGEGQIRVRTAAIGVANPDFHVAVTNVNVTTVTDPKAGTLEIDEGLVLEANTAQMGERWLGAGDYAAEASDGVRPCKYLSGAGILRVRTYGGPKGLMIIIQ